MISNTMQYYTKLRSTHTDKGKQSQSQDNMSSSSTYKFTCTEMTPEEDTASPKVANRDLSQKGGRSGS